MMAKKYPKIFKILLDFQKIIILTCLVGIVNIANGQCPVVTNFNVTDVSCFGISDGQILLTVTSGILPYTYNWDNGETSNPATMLTAGITTLTITDANACSATSSYLIQEPALLIATSNSTDLTCFGSNDGTVTAIVNGGTPGYTYNWDNGQVTQTVVNLIAGSYTVTVVDQNGCIVVQNVTVTEPAFIDVSGIVTNTQCSSLNGSIDLTITQGAPPYTISWSIGAITENIVGLPAGTYTVEVTDANGCIATKAFIVNSQPSTLILNCFPQNDLCNTGVGGSITCNVSGGQTPYTYSWTNGSNTQTLSNLSPGTYCLTVTDANGCVESGCYNIDIPNPPLQADAGSTLVQCITTPTILGGSDVAMFGTPPYSYNWTPMIFLNDPTLQNPTAAIVPATTTFVVLVTDSNGCTATSSIEVEPSSLEITSSVITPNCGGNSGSISVVGTTQGSPIEYIWSSGQTTSTITGLISGTYTVTLTDINCYLSESYIVLNDTCVWPGDTNYDGYANNQDVLYIGLKYGQTGPVRFNATYDWIGQTCENWLDTISTGNNIKHIDGDGDGVITQDDTTAISINYNAPVHPLNFGSPAPSGGVDPPLYFEFSQGVIAPNQLLAVDVYYGDMTTPAVDLYGIALTIDFNEAYVVPSSIYFDFDGSWIGTPSETVSLSHYLPGALQFGIARTDKMNISGFGKLGTMYLVIEDNIDGLLESNMGFEFLDVLILSNDESTLPYANLPGQVFVTTQVGITSPDDDLHNKVLIFPNPASEFINLQSFGPKLLSVTFLNILGQSIYEQKIEQALHWIVDTNNIKPGAYLIVIDSDEGKIIQKITLLD